MTLLAALINVAMVGTNVDAIGDGLRVHGWREPQLIELQKQLSEVNLMNPLRAAIETEAAATTRILETIPFTQVNHAFGTHSALLIAPRGWVLQNIANNLQFYSPEAFDLERGNIKPSVLKDSEKSLVEEFSRHKSPFRIFAKIMIPNFNKASRAAARGQTAANEALVACALERYHIAVGAYPDSLDALVPKFLSKVPHDIIGGEPLKYRRTDAGYVLYSIGWNEKDDGGVTPTAINNGMPDLDDGDWVWQYAAK
jgi:hypothetical protein